MYDWRKRKLINRMFIIVKDNKGHCEFLRFSDENNLYTSPNKDRSFIGDTYDDYESEVNYAEKHFPQYSYVILHESTLPRINKFPDESSNIVSRPI